MKLKYIGEKVLDNGQLEITFQKKSGKLFSIYLWADERGKDLYFNKIRKAINDEAEKIWGRKKKWIDFPITNDRVRGEE